VDAGILAILLIFGTPLILGLGGLMLTALKMITGSTSSRQDKAGRQEEARMIQAIYQSLAGMDQRIEALETLLLEHKGERTTSDERS